MHRALRSAETIGRRVGAVAEAKYGSNCKKGWFNEMAKVAKKSSAADEHKLAFSENGTIAFVTNFRSFLLNSGFKGLTMETLSTFSDGLANLFELLLNTPVGLTGKEFDTQARVLLGFQFVQIFGTKMITATIKQIAVYTGYNVEQARLDGIESGLPISLHHFSDGLMKTAHKSTKSGSVRCSGGRAEPSSNIQYQEAVLSQQMLNKLMQINNRENNPITFSARKLKRKLVQQANDQESVTCKKKRLGVRL